MNNLGFIEKLLDGVVVEWVAVEEIFDIKNGYTPSKSNSSYWENGTIPWFRMEDIRENGRILSDSLQKVSIQAAKGGNLFSANSIIISTSATIGEHALITVPFLANQRFICLTLKSDFSSLLDIKFLYYYGFLLSDWCKKNTTQSSFASVVMDGFKKYPIPIPCPDNPKKSLEIQAEIVRILDAFTAMTTELTAELNLRKKQYNYYRDQLLSFEEGEVEWVAVEEIFDIKNGYTPSKSNSSYWENGTIPWFRMEDIRENGRILSDSLQKVSIQAAKGGNLFSANSIIISTSATIGEHALITVPFLANQRFICLTLKSDFSSLLDIKFLYYYGFLLSDWCKKNTTQSSFASVVMDGFKKYPIPIPCPDNPKKSLEEQARIVAILDKFDTLTNSITEGLPREIELRQKQYEYYRDLLFSFPKPEVVV